jgi:hypothetical protein
MLKRLLVAAAVAATTLVISGSPIITKPASAADALCPAAEPTAPPGSTGSPPTTPCRWEQRYEMWCRFCYEYGQWRLNYCNEM